jgi:hypothetical protein
VIRINLFLHVDRLWGIVFREIKKWPTYFISFHPTDGNVLSEVNKSSAAIDNLLLYFCHVVILLMVGRKRPFYSLSITLSACCFWNAIDNIL